MKNIPSISPRSEAIMEVRRRTEAAVTICLKALKETEWNVDMAVIKIAKSRHDDQSKSNKHDVYGIVCPYVHALDRIGVLVELSCESSFVAKSREFIKLANIIAMHIAWSNPKGIERSDVQADFGEVCLLDQPEIKEAKGLRTIRELLAELSCKTGEDIKIKRFSRFEIGSS